MNDAIRQCHITKVEKAGALIQFADGQLGYVPSTEFFWKWRRGSDPSHDFKENQKIEVVPSRGHRDEFPHYSYKRANREPWNRTVEWVRSAMTDHPEHPVEVVGNIVTALPDRVYVGVETQKFDVDAIVTCGGLPLPAFSAYADRPLNDFLFEGDRIRAVVESISEQTSEIFLSVRELREQTLAMGRRSTGSGLGDPHGRLQALRNRLEAPDEPTWNQLQQYASTDRVAVVCEDEELKLAILALLKAVGFTTASCTTPRDLLNDPPDVIVLDADRALARGGLLEEIRSWTAAAHEAKLVLLYSNLSMEGLRQLRAAGSLYHGVVRKWFKPQELLSTIRTVRTAFEQFNEPHPPDGGSWREMAMQDAVDHERNREDALARIFCQLQIGLGATAVALVQFNCGTRQATLVANAGLDRQYFDAARTYLNKSPVRDIVEDHVCYQVTDAHWDEAKFRHLHKIFPHHIHGRHAFRSFLGMRLVDFGHGYVQTGLYDRKTLVAAPTSDAGSESYALLAFHPAPQEFSPASWQLFCRTALLILTVLERDVMRQELVKFSGYVLVAREASFLLHEFRTRISAVQVWNGLLERDIEAIAARRVPLPGQIDQLLATSTSLKRVAAGLNQIITLFLNLSVEGRQSFRIGALIDELRLVFREPLRDLNARLETDLKWDEEIISNRGQVTQILSNLIQNALDQFRIAGCKSPEIGVIVEMMGSTNGGSPSQNTIRITVVDNGIGISQLHFGKIFEYNFTTKPDGSGIGLHVSRLIAESLRGSLVLETSERFLQTRFVFTIPI